MGAWLNKAANRPSLRP